MHKKAKLNFIREACVENLQQALSAETKGADRIELCSRLELDGLTPSNELILEVKNRLKIPVRIMIRPRAGGFVYTEEEISEMKTSIEFCKNAGVEGVVFGMLKKNGSLDLENIIQLAALARPLKVVIHKAIDDTTHPVEATKELIKVKGVSAILSSGGERTAFEGANVLREMIRLSEGELEIIAAGKITEDNILQIRKLIGARAYHGRLIVGSLE